MYRKRNILSEEDIESRRQEYKDSETDRIKRKKAKLPTLGSLNEAINKFEALVKKGDKKFQKDLDEAVEEKKSYYEGTLKLKRK